MIRFTVLFFSTLLACNLFDKGRGEQAKVGAGQLGPMTMEEASDRLLSNHLEDGFVVSKTLEGEVRHEGDSLIFTGLALSALPCDRGTVLEDRLIGMMEETGGAVYRHPRLSDKASLDGLLGLYLGVSSRLKNCQSHDRWRGVMALHRDWMNQSKGQINPHDNAYLTPGFDYLKDLLFHRLDLGEEPTKARRRILEHMLSGWALAVTTQKAACYRVNLAQMTYEATENLGGQVTGDSKDYFCSVTKKLQLPLVDHWCGREGLVEYIQTFNENEWEYRHQRCPAWESPDGGGLVTPAVDFIKALYDAQKTARS